MKPIKVDGRALRAAMAHGDGRETHLVAVHKGAPGRAAKAHGKPVQHAHGPMAAHLAGAARKAARGKATG